MTNPCEKPPDLTTPAQPPDTPGHTDDEWRAALGVFAEARSAQERLEAVAAVGVVDHQKLQAARYATLQAQKTLLTMARHERARAEGERRERRLLQCERDTLRAGLDYIRGVAAGGASEVAAQVLAGEHWTLGRVRCWCGERHLDEREGGG